ncbi:unnamed protein product, partial [Adineta steineri]
MLIGHPNEDPIKKELVQLTESHTKFEQESKIKLGKAFIDCADANSRSKSLECSLQIAQDELKRFNEQNEQRSLISDIEIQLRDFQTRCTDIEIEKQRIQNDFDEYYQRTHHLEESQQKSIQNGTAHGRFQVQSSLLDPIIENNNSIDIPILKENGENETHDEPIMPLDQIDPIVNHNHTEKYDNINGHDSVNELIEAQKQIVLLRENLNKTNERVVSAEDSYRSEQERYRSLISEHELIRDELNQLKI